METVAIEELFTWSKPERVNTRQGPRLLRTTEADEHFWINWRASKTALKEAGVSVTKKGDDWVVNWWQKIPKTAEELKAEEEALEMSRATDADVDLLSPEGLDYLPYQRAGIAYGMSRDAVLIGDEMGLGKTIQAIGIWNNDPSLGTALVVCPASLRLNWKKEFEKWSTRPVKVAIIDGGGAKAWPSDLDFDILVVNYDVLGKHREKIDEIGFDLVIGDEAHFLKNPKTARTVAFFGRKKSKNKKTGEQIPAIPPIRARRRVLLSGTPIANKPVELFPLLQYLDPTGIGADFFSYAKRYCDAKRTEFGWDFSGSSHLGELQDKLRAGLMIRRLKKNVLKELPAKRRQVIEIPAGRLDGLIREELEAVREHEETLANLAAYIDLAKCEDDPEAEQTARSRYKEKLGLTIDQMTRLRLQVAVAKADLVIEQVEAALESGPVVLFAHHKEVVAKFMEHFGDRARKVTGDVSMEDREEAVELFQAGKIDLFVGNIAAAGVGLTLTRSSHVIFAELDWVPGNLSQAEDRCHRIGQLDSVLVQHIVLEGSLDAVMAAKLVEKQDVIDLALDVKREDREPEEEEPPSTNRVRKIQVTRKEIDKAAEAVDAVQRETAHFGMKIVAGLCDGARQLDGMGFSGSDAAIGHSFARQLFLTPRQAVLAIKLCKKYRRQIDAVEPGLVEKLAA